MFIRATLKERSGSLVMITFLTDINELEFNMNTAIFYEQSI